jgi:hypothetical protein
MKPTKIEYDLGQTIYGQPLRLVRGRDSAGNTVWTLHRDQGDQRDDSTFITGLNTEHILKMTEAAKSLQ